MQHLFIVSRTAILHHCRVKFESIIWDWNGTLLNDADIAVAIINQLLVERDLRPITIAHYLEVFTFPVRDYYVQIGFDFKIEPFEVPAHQFIISYNKAVETCSLHQHVIRILGLLQNRGYRQFILSAMEQKQLEKTVLNSGITHFIEGLCGLDNHFASSKVENGRLLIETYSLNPKLTLMVGDTVHDYEVAQAIGCSCVLIAHGHQSKERLLKTGVKVLDNLDEIDLLLE